MRETLECKREEFCDVLVVGGGTAGIFAAIAAARNGAKTLLAEKNGILGGTMTVGGHGYPGLFYAWGRQIIGGPCFDALKRCEARGGAKFPEITYKPKHHDWEQIKLNPAVFAIVAEEMCAESGVSLRYHTMVAGARESATGVDVFLTGKEGLWAVRARRVIDCTGDANVACMLGFPVEAGEETQPASLHNSLSGYDIDRIDRDEVERLFRAALSRGEVYESDFQGLSPYIALMRRSVPVHCASGVASHSPQRTELEIRARRTLLRAVRFLQSVPGAENLAIAEMSTECAVRETVRIVGEETMTAERYLSGYRYPSAVAYCFYPIDRHEPNGIFQIFLKEEVIPTVPYGALVPKGSDKLLVAGRSASGDRDANSAYRVQAPCMAMGQAAGVAAALSAAGNVGVREVPLEELKSKLAALGAIVP